MNACGGTCFRGLCAQRNVIPSVKLISTPLCSPTSHPFGEATYSMEMPSFDSPMKSSEKIAPKKKIVRPKRLLRDAVISPNLEEDRSNGTIRWWEKLR